MIKTLILISILTSNQFCSNLKKIKQDLPSKIFSFGNNNQDNKKDQSNSRLNNNESFSNKDGSSYYDTEYMKAVQWHFKEMWTFDQNNQVNINNENFISNLRNENKDIEFEFNQQQKSINSEDFLSITQVYEKQRAYNEKFNNFLSKQNENLISNENKIKILKYNDKKEWLIKSQYDKMNNLNKEINYLKEMMKKYKNDVDQQKKLNEKLEKNKNRFEEINTKLIQEGSKAIKDNKKKGSRLATLLIFYFNLNIRALS